jgi:acetylornithine deacetylase/succinyl-diaminopimelate desuccinylase-like protein
VHGRSGHASMPGIADNALVKAAPLLARLGEVRLAAALLPETKAFLQTVLGSAPEPDEALARLREVAPGIASMVEPMLRTTISPTQILASGKRNVVPALCEIVCDCRILPGQTAVDVERAIREALGTDGYELEWLDFAGGSRSSFETPLWEAIASFVDTEEPGAALVPVLLPGFTDSHYLREAFGTIAYGFFPMRAMDADQAALLVHSADERVPVDDLELGTSFLVSIAREVVG